MGHHYVPQRYLRNFENPKRSGSLWLYDKRDNVARSAAIKSVAQSKGFYSQEIENLLALEVEVPGNRAIASLVGNRKINIGERLQLAYYIATMFKRVPRHRRKATEMLPDVLDEVIKNVRQQFRSLMTELQTEPELAAKRLREIDIIHAKLSVQTPQCVLDQIHEPWPSESIVRAVFEMSWRVLVSSGPQFFLTSDNPAYFFEAYGLLNESAELSFPLSSTHVLHGSWQGPREGIQFVNVNQRVVREINKRLISGAERLVFYHEQVSWIFQILTKQDLYLNRVTW